MSHVLTKIVEGPREDGRVIYFCEKCQRNSTWILPSTKLTQQTVHNCRKIKQKPKPAVSETEAVNGPCAATFIRNAIGLLSLAAPRIDEPADRENVEDVLNTLSEILKIELRKKKAERDTRI